MLNIVLFGPPGSGKGTQANMLIEKYGLVHLSTGDILRAEIKKGSELGKQVQAVIAKGNLVSDEMVIALIRNAVKENKDAKGFIFDGFPRTVVQAEELDKMLEEESLSISLMATMEVEDEELIRRIIKRGESSGRADDTDENIIRNRINVYNKETAPVAGFYQKQGKHCSVDNKQSIEHAFNILCEHIDKVK